MTDIAAFHENVYYIKTKIYISVVVQLYPWFNFDFPLFLSMLVYDNEYQTEENQN